MVVNEKDDTILAKYDLARGTAQQVILTAEEKTLVDQYQKAYQEELDNLANRCGGRGHISSEEENNLRQQLWRQNPATKCALQKLIDTTNSILASGRG